MPSAWPGGSWPPPGPPPTRCVARWAIDLAAREFALGTDDGDCNGTQYQRCGAEAIGRAIGRAIDLCRRAEEALAVADLAGKSGPAFRALESAALRAKDRFDTVRSVRASGDPVQDDPP